VTLPGQTVVTTLPGSTVTLTTQLPATTFVSTILVTQILTATQVVPTTTTVVQTLVPTPSSSTSVSIPCTSKCQIDVTAKRLAYPGTIVVSTVYVPTVTLDYSTDAAGNVASTRLYTQPLPASTTSDITWEFSGVPLTWPTVYAAYATFNRVSVSPVGNTCRTSILSLALPTPTSWQPLIIEETNIPNPALVAPRVTSYLNTLPTVIAQLGGPIGGNACDPIVGPPSAEGTDSLGMRTVVSTAAIAGTSTRYVAAQAAVSQPPLSEPPPSQAPPTSATPSPSPPPPPPPPSQSSAAPSSPPPSPSNTPIPSPSSATPVPSPSTPPQLSSEVPASSSIVPLPSSPPSVSSVYSESSRADSASQVSPPAPISPSYGQSSVASPPPPVTPSRSTTSSQTSVDGTSSAPRSSFSGTLYTGAAVLPTGKIAGWLVGAAGLGLGLM
jgi:hypothetical protein